MVDLLCGGFFESNLYILLTPLALKISNVKLVSIDADYSWKCDKNEP